MFLTRKKDKGKTGLAFLKLKTVLEFAVKNVSQPA